MIDLTRAQATPHWQLLTPTNVTLRNSFPWGRSLQKILWHTQPRRFTGSSLFVASDYGGEHRASSHLVYAFMVSDGGGPRWLNAISEIRTSLLPDGKRMAFKRLDDAARRNSLIPFLQAADKLNGHLVVVAINKKIRWLMTQRSEAEKWRDSFGLRATWNDRSLEDMMRKAYIFSVLISLWSRHFTNVCWITDQDQSVANEHRLDDMQRIAARLTMLLIDHPMGEFAMNSTAIDDAQRSFEDLCALPDLAAGMVAEICADLQQSATGDVAQASNFKQLLSRKSEIISNWFWHPHSQLQKTMIRIDRIGTQNMAQKIEMRISCHECSKEYQSLEPTEN